MDELKLEEFQEFLRRYTEIFNKNVTLMTDNTYKNSKNFINNKNMVVLKGDIKTQL